MKPFSLVNLKELDRESQNQFCETLSGLMANHIDDISKDDVLNVKVLQEFIENKGVVYNAITIVSELYCNLTAGIQAGSGNQSLYNTLVAHIVTAWQKVS